MNTPKRHRDPDGWVYEDPEQSWFAFACRDEGLNLHAFDDYIDACPAPVKNRLLERRTDALQALKAGQHSLFKCRIGALNLHACLLKFIEEVRPGALDHHDWVLSRFSKEIGKHANTGREISNNAGKSADSKYGPLEERQEDRKKYARSVEDLYRKHGKEKTWTNLATIAGKENKVTVGVIKKWVQNPQNKYNHLSDNWNYTDLMKQDKSEKS